MVCCLIYRYRGLAVLVRSYRSGFVELQRCFSKKRCVISKKHSNLIWKTFL